MNTEKAIADIVAALKVSDEPPVDAFAFLLSNTLGNIERSAKALERVAHALEKQNALTEEMLLGR